MRKVALSTLACASFLGASLFGSAAMAQSMARYQVSISNLTNNQPLSPLAAVIHSPGYHPFQIGMPASAGLEQLAEGGDTSLFLSEARAQTDSVQQTRAGDAAIAPGASAQLMLHIDASISDPRLSLASMLVNTNDAFTALNAHSLAGLAVGESMTLTSIAFDAGTEDNSEAQGTIPGPADGGEGYNAARSADDRVSAHPGVITQDDGLSSSVLNQSHRFLNPVTQVSITRLADMPSQNYLGFPGLQTEYRPGDRLLVTVAEMSDLRQRAEDLWVALILPDDTVSFMTPTGSSLMPEPFQTQVSLAQKQHVVFDTTLPPGLAGSYTLLAFYGAYQNGIWAIYSEIAQAQVTIFDE